MQKPLPYPIMSALRGPDIPSITACNVKNLTTAVIRYFTNLNLFKFSITINSPSDAMYFWETLCQKQKDDITDFIKTHKHFTNHIALAMLAYTTHLEGDQKAQFMAYKSWTETTILGGCEWLDLV